MQYMHAKMFSIQRLLHTFQSNCAEGLVLFIYISIVHQLETHVEIAKRLEFYDEYNYPMV